MLPPRRRSATRRRHFQNPGAAQTVLTQAGVESEDGGLLIEREILAGGSHAHSRVAGPRPPPFRAKSRSRSAIYTASTISSACSLLTLSSTYSMSLPPANPARRSRRNLPRMASLLGGACGNLIVPSRKNFCLLDLWSFQRNEIEETRKSAKKMSSKANAASCRTSGGCSRPARAYEAVCNMPRIRLSSLKTALKRVEEVCRIDDKPGGSAWSHLTGPDRGPGGLLHCAITSPNWKLTRTASKKSKPSGQYR